MIDEGNALGGEGEPPKADAPTNPHPDSGTEDLEWDPHLQLDSQFFVCIYCCDVTVVGGIT